MHDLQDLFVCRPSLFCRKSILRLNEEVLFWSPGMQAMYCTGVLLQLEGIGSTIMGIALMIGMLVTPYAEEAFGSFGSRPVERMWWEVHTKIGLKGPRLPMRICSVLLVFYRFSWSQGLCGLSMLRYMKEHVAVALGIVAVIVVAIAVASKQLGLKYLTWMTCWFSCRYPEWLWISFSGISHVGLRRFFFVLLTAHLRVFRWETASNCRRPRLQMAAYLKWVFGMPNGCRVLAAWCKYIEGCHRFFAFACFCIYSWTKRADTRNQMQISNMLLQVHGRCSQKDSIFRPSKLTSGFLQAVDKVKRLLSKQKQRLAGINTGYLCQGVPLGHNICFDMSQFSGRSTDLSIAADTLLVIEASADTTWQICSLETPQHHITQTRCIAVSSFQLHGFIAEEPQIQLMLHQTKGEGVKSTVLRQCKQHLNSFS